MLRSRRADREERSTLHQRVSPARTAIALAAVAALAITGCSSSPAKPKPASTSTSQASAFEARTKQLTVALVSCFYRHHLIPRRATDGRPFGTPRLPVQNGQVATSSAADRTAVLWWFASVGDTLPVKGVSMGAWLGNSAMVPTDWPKSICGPIPPPSG
jgi:hypothetical protein